MSVSDLKAERYLAEARQAVGSRLCLERTHLDLLEGKLRFSQARYADALQPLERALDDAADRTSACQAAQLLIQSLTALSMLPDEALKVLENAEHAWGPMPELHDLLPP